MAKVTLTDRKLQALAPAPAGKRYDVWDALVPGLGVRVTDKGQRSFVLAARYPGATDPTRRALGEYRPLGATERQASERAYEALPEARRQAMIFDEFLLETYGATVLAAARVKARRWIELIARGIDPKIQEERDKRTHIERQANTFELVAEAFFADKLAGERKGAEVERDIRREFMPAWKGRPITDITALDVRNVVAAVKARGATYQAHNLLGYARRLFAWAIDQQVYGLTASPCDRLRPKAIIGAKAPRQRILDDDEIRAFWRAAARLAYPYGPVCRLLLLTGQRHGEVAKARRSEFHPELLAMLRKGSDAATPINWRAVPAEWKLWSIGEERFKSDARHMIPLSDDACAKVCSDYASSPVSFTGGFSAMRPSLGPRWPLRPPVASR